MIRQNLREWTEVQLECLPKERGYTQIARGASEHHLMKTTFFVKKL